jgi:hypothetical protein
MAKNSDEIYSSHADIVKRIFENKAQFHRQQACLPIEEKIQILIELQKIALTLHPNRGPNDARIVWQLTP